MLSRIVTGGLAALLIALFSPNVAGAEACPPEPPSDSLERREVARRFFDLAQAAQAEQRNNQALIDYVCSFKMVRHPFTAYNMAGLADKTGDLELALSSYKAYLELSPDAPDRDQVTGEIERLQGRIDRLNENANIRAMQADPVSSRRPRTTATPAPPEPVDLVERAPAPAASTGTSPGRAGWFAVGGGAAALAVGTVLNIMARSNMNNCRANWMTDQTSAMSDCDAAKSQAYGSYVAFGLGAAAAAVGIYMLTLSGDDEGAEQSRSHATRFALIPLMGGGYLAAHTTWR